MKYFKYIWAGLGMALLLPLLSMMGPGEQAVHAQSASTINPSLVLIQLGVEGVTATGGPSYADCLVKTDTNGVIDISLIPADNPIALYRLTGVFWIDGVNGEDIADNGAIESPYKTFEFAITDSNIADPVFVFAPGTYAAPATSLTDTNLDGMTLLAYAPELTTITGTLIYNMARPVTLDVYKIQLNGVKQNRNGFDVTVKLADRAGLSNFTTLFPVGGVYTVVSDPSVTTLPGQSYIVHDNLHTADFIGFSPTNATRQLWGTNTITVAEALDELSEGHILPLGVTTGAIGTWNGTNWVEITAGATTDLLFGGATPTWDNPTNHFLTNYYTSVQVDDALTNYYTITLVDNLFTNYYTIPEMTNILSAYYTTNQVNNLFTNYYTTNQIANLFDMYYTTNQVDTLLTNKFDKAGGVIWGDTDATGDFTFDGEPPVVWVTAPVVPVSAGELGQVAFEVSGGTNYMYWYHPDAGGAGQARWVRVVGELEW